MEKIIKFNELGLTETPATPLTRIFKPPHPIGDDTASESNSRSVLNKTESELSVAQHSALWAMPSTN